MLQIPENKTTLNDCNTISFKLRYGCYVITAEVDKAIQRVGGLDEKRILYIGSGIIKTRLNMFQKVIFENKSRGHSGATTYNRRSQLYLKMYPLTKLKAHFKEFNSKKTATNHEVKLLTSYEKTYGELPPLNKNIPKKSESHEY
ncbi:MAG: hypothetical protein ACPGVC_11005 [Salibacteraceae bacterium]